MITDEYILSDDARQVQRRWLQDEMAKSIAAEVDPRERRARCRAAAAVFSDHPGFDALAFTRQCAVQA